MNFDSFLEMKKIKKYTGGESHSLDPQLLAIGESHNLVSGVGFSPGHLGPARRSVDRYQTEKYVHICSSRRFRMETRMDQRPIGRPSDILQSRE